MEIKTQSRQGLTRRAVMAAVGAGWAAATFAATPRQAIAAEVWKDANCGCCKDWVAHLEANGFKVKVNDGGNEAARAKLGVPAQYGSCHTALIGGYAIEGHVPAREIQRLLKEKPPAVGLSVPGMPVGSPGMDAAIYQGRKDPYNVMLLAKDGSATVYQQYAAAGTVGAVGAVGTAGLTDAEVRKVDKEARKITLKHEAIKNLDMPAMTMVFQVSDPAMLDKVKAGDKVRFKASGDGGKYTVTEIQPAK